MDPGPGQSGWLYHGQTRDHAVYVLVSESSLRFVLVATMAPECCNYHKVNAIDVLIFIKWATFRLPLLTEYSMQWSLFRSASADCLQSIIRSSRLPTNTLPRGAASVPSKYMLFHRCSEFLRATSILSTNFVRTESNLFWSNFDRLNPSPTYAGGSVSGVTDRRCSGAG